MSKTKRILIVEDNPNDYDLARREIRKLLDSSVFKRVETYNDYLAELKSFQPDLILSDYSLPSFDGMEALQLAQEHVPLTPLIIWTGSMSEEVAAECMKAGAQNYVLKENTKRLGPAVLHALEERQLLLERNEVENKLSRSEANYRALAENSLQGIAIFQKQRIVYVNPAMCAIMGYTSDELLAMSEEQILALTHPADRGVAQDRALRRQTGDPVSAFNDVRIIRKDGTIRWIQTFANSIQYDGQPAILSTSIDVTERKQAEEKYQNLFMHSADGIFQSTPEGRYINVNPAMARIYGYDSPQDMIESVTDITEQIYVDPNDRQDFIGQFHTQDASASFEVQNYRKDGSIIWTSTSARAVRDSSGNILYYEGFLRDISKRKQAEEKLRVQESHFRALLENSLDSISLLSAEGVLIWENPSVERPLGYEPGTFINRNIFEMMHPDDLDWTSKLFAQIVREPGNQQRGIFRLKHKDGTWRWIQARGTNKLDDPNIAAVVINYRDITELKQAEGKYQDIFEDSPVGIFQSTPGGQFINVNSAMARIYGYDSPQDMIHSISDISGQLYLTAQDRKAFTQLLETGDTVREYEMENIRKDGSVFWTSTSARVVRGSDGNVLYYEGFLQDVTERKNAEAQISDLLSLNEKILNHSPLGILTYKLTGECIFANARAAAIVGTTVADLRAQNFHTIESWKRSGLYALVEQAISTNSLASGDIHHISTFGKAIWMSVRCVTFQSKEEQHLLLSISDITERRQAEEELRQKNEDLRLINVVNNAVVRGQNLDSVIDLVASELKRIFSAVGSTIYMLSADKRSISMHQYSFSPETEHKIEKLIGFRIPKIEIPIKEGGHFHNALLSKQSAITNDPKKIQEWIAEFVETKSLPTIARAAVRKLVPHIYKLLKIKSTIIVPLISQEQVIGFLDISGAALFTPNDLKRIEAIGEQLTSLIQRQQADEAIRKSEEFLQGIQNSLSAHIAILDEHGVIVQVNEAWRAFGDENGSQNADYCIGMNYLAVCEAASGLEAQVAQETAAAIRQVLSGAREDASIEYACHSPTERRWFTLHITCFNDGKQKWVILAHENITEWKLAEEQLQQSESRYRTAIENQTEFIVRWKPDGTRTFVNDAYCRYFGVTREQALNTDFAPLIYAEDRPVVEEKITRLISGETRVEAETHRVVKPDGSIYWNEWTDQAIYDQDGQLVEFQAVGRDVTERKEAESALLQSQARYQILFDKSPISLWEEDFSLVKRRIDTLRESGVTDFGEYFDRYPDEIFELASLVRIIDVNKASLDLFRAPKKEDLLKNLELLVEKDVLLHFREELLGLLSPTRGFVWEGSDKTFQGDAIDVVVTGTIPAGYEEDWSRVLVSIVDITKRKRAEEALRDSEEKYRLLFESNPLPMWIYDLETLRFLKVNGSAIDHYGYTENEFMAMTIKDIRPSVDVPRLVKNISQVKNGIDKAGTWNHLKKDGSLIEVEIVSHTVEFDGRAAQLVLANDITERNRAEDELRASEERFRQLANNIEEVFWMTEAQTGREIYASPAAERIWGMGLETLLHEPDVYINTVLPEDRSLVLRAIEREKAGEKVEMEYRIGRPDGSVRWIWDRAFPIFDENGKVKILAGISADITERKQSELEIQRHLIELEALYENGLTVGRLFEPREIGNQIIETFARHLSWHHVAIRLLNPETDRLELIAFNQPGLSDESRAEMEMRLKTMVSKVGQGLSGWAMQTGSSIRTGNVHTHPQYVDTHQGIMSGLYMPLKVGDRIIGSISVESDQPDAFTGQDERLLATLANQAAIAFENARLYQSAQQELRERKRAQDALWSSETHYRQLADSITDVLFELDHNLCFTHWNKASEMLTGIPQQDAIGKSMFEIFGDSEEQKRIEKIYQRVLSDRQAQRFEINLAVQTQIHDFEINAYPSTHGVSVVARDITERKLSERMLRKRFELIEYSNDHSLEDLMQKLVDEVSSLTGSHIGFLHLVDADEITITLQAWSTETIQHLSRVDGTGMHYPLDQAGVWADAVRQRRPVIHDDYESLPYKSGLPEGHLEVKREMVLPILRNEKIVAVIGVGNKEQNYTEQDVDVATRFADYAWDITERRRIESELAEERNQLARRVEERTADLSRANSNLARALRVKDEFLANMSHELRTPLNAILGLSESLSEQVAGPLNEKQAKYLSTINESGHHLLSLINDILDLAKIEAGQITLDINKVDVNSVCQASLRMIKQLAQKKNQDVSFRIDPHFGLMWADERRLKQMIVNLLSNAVKFTSEMGKLGLEVDGDREGNIVSISVWDEGIGISSNDLPRLFKPFVQLDSGLAREATGTGLGLALVAQMAQMHGGSVTVESQQGQGSRFTIRLPWEPAMAGDTVARLKSTGKFRAIKPDEVRPTVLLIEDTQEVVMMLVDYLEMAGFNMVTAQDGIDGLTQAKIAHPDLILMDIQMPRMDGFETTKKLRSDPEFKDTPIIALTALAMPNDRQRCLDAGMNEYLSKPVNLKVLSKTMKAFLYEEESNQV